MKFTRQYDAMDCGPACVRSHPEGEQDVLIRRGDVGEFD